MIPNLSSLVRLAGRGTLRARAGCIVSASVLIESGPLAYAQESSPERATEADEETIVLSPFEVSADADQGYASRETLAGSRLKANLRDVPSQVQVLTAQFLQDLAVGSIEEAYRYSINVENLDEFQSAAGGDFNSGVVNVNGLNRVRGLETAGATHDFFRSWLPRDAYNTERVALSSGPNAILFGNSNPAGGTDTSFIRARLDRARYTLGLRVDDEKSWRTTVDINQPLIQNKLGLRLAALKASTNDWRAPAGEENERLFATLTYKPFESTTIRGWYERAILDRRTARNTRVHDAITPWIAAGRPVFDNGLTTPSASPAASDSVFQRNTTTKNVYVLGASAPIPLMAWGSSGSSNAPSVARYSVFTKGPGDPPHQTGVDSYDYSLRDTSISPNDISVHGNGTRNYIDASIYGVSAEQRLARDLHLEVSYNEEKNINPVADFLRGIEATIQVDANKYLPDRVTPNPNLGRYYVEGSGRATRFLRREKEARAVLSYDLDLMKFNQWLGRHRLAGLVQRTDNIALQQDFLNRVVPAGAAYDTVLNSYTNNTYNTVNWRAYLSDPADPSTGSVYYLDLPFDVFKPFTLPDGSTSYTVDNPYGATSQGNYVHNRLDGLVLATQSYFLKDRLVVTFGWRDDRARQSNLAPPRRGTGAAAAYSTYDHLSVPNEWQVWNDGTTTTEGAVLHVFPWASVYYNQSETWSPVRSARGPDGTQLPGSIGTGKDYGIMFRFFDERFSIRLNRYENEGGPGVDTSVRNTLLAPIRLIEQTLADAAEAGQIPAPPPTPGFDPFAPSTTYDATAFQRSEGYEFELVANPTPNWRLTINGAKSEAMRSQVATDWIAFVNDRVDVWRQYPDLAGPADDTAPRTIRQRFESLYGVLNLLRQSDGQRTEQDREWRINGLTRYTFSDGVLKGFSVGGGYRYRSRGVIGYRATTVPNEFNFPGLPDQITVPSIDAPIHSRELHEFEAIFGYTRKILRNVEWTAQLNIRNLLNDQGFVGQRANTSGIVSIVTVPTPRSFVLTNTFRF